MLLGNMFQRDGKTYRSNMPQHIYQMANGFPGQAMFNNVVRSGAISPVNGMGSGMNRNPQPSVPVQTPEELQAQYNRLASQASNALNGGLLGYQPSEIRAAGSNPQTFTGPSNSFRFPFGLLNGMGS
jgi:hypothetical protein